MEILNARMNLECRKILGGTQINFWSTVNDGQRQSTRSTINGSVQLDWLDLDPLGLDWINQRLSSDQSNSVSRLNFRTTNFWRQLQACSVSDRADFSGIPFLLSRSSIWYTTLLYAAPRDLIIQYRANRHALM